MASSPRRSASSQPSQASPQRVLAALAELAGATGVDGMVGGQYVDVTDAEQTPEGLRSLHSLKTGRLIGASVGIVLVLEGIAAEEAGPYRRFASELGVLFQIVDDILDVTGSDEELGKPRGSDERHGKLTYVSLYGLERARELAKESHEKAVGVAGSGRRRHNRPSSDRRLHLHEERMSPDPKDNPSGAPPLSSIDGPADLKGLDDAQLQEVAQELRTYIIDVIGEIGGHFGANLGTCELAVALHSLLESPRDKILWDVGHQSYPHKVLTGRRDELPTIRQYEGLAPFCSIAESEHDIMGAGHASTSIGYGVGLKEAMRKGLGEDGKVVAVIGDGALTGGVAYEALQAAGGLQTPMVIVLNDNGMSISPNVGALSRYFNRARLNPKWWHAREEMESRLTKLPLGLGERIERLGPEIKAALKAYWAPGLLFEELDLAYVGVIDGHDVGAIREAMSEALDADRPVVVHIHTVKGKGFAPSEEGGLEGMEKWHAAKPGSIVGGEPAKKPKPGSPPTAPSRAEIAPSARRLKRRARVSSASRNLTRPTRSRPSAWPSPSRRRRPSTRRSSPTRWSPRRAATGA